MKRTTQLMAILSLSFLILMGISCKNNQSEFVQENNSRVLVKFYRHLQFTETPYDITKGIYELSPDEAKTVNNYKFTYDAKSRLISLEYNRNGILLPYGRGAAAKVQMVYTDSTETHNYFNMKGEQIESFDKVYQSVYTLNHKGERTGLSFRNAPGEEIENSNKIASYEWEILADGMVKENRFDLGGKETILNESCPFYELRFSYDANAYVTRMANYIDDELYNCTADNCGDDGVSYFTFESNEKGALLDFKVFNIDGKYANLFFGWARFTLSLDSLGYVAERIYYNENEELIQTTSAPIMQFTYDIHGAISEIRMLDENRKPFESEKSKVSLIRYTYSEQGFPVDTIRLNKNMEQI